MLPRRNRLPRMLFPSMFSKSARLIYGKDLILRYRPLPGAAIQIGIVVPKAAAAQATRRNQIKRVLRAALREQLLRSDQEGYAIAMSYRRREREKKGESKPENSDLRAQVAILCQE